MDKKFGGKQATGTPSLAWSCAVVIVSLLAGASVVHNIYKPDLVNSLCVFALTLYGVPISYDTMPPGNIHGTEQEQVEKT